MNNDNNDIMDLLSLLSIILQLKVMEDQNHQSNNDDIMKELQRQDKAYLEKIVQNQNIIIQKLNKLAFMLAD